MSKGKLGRGNQRSSEVFAQMAIRIRPIRNTTSFLRGLQRQPEITGLIMAAFRSLLLLGSSYVVAQTQWRPQNIFTMSSRTELCEKH